MKFRLTAKSYNYKGKEYHKGDVLELDSIEQIPVIFRQFFTIVEDDKVNNVADKVTNTNTDTTELKEEAKSDTTELKEEAKSDTTELKEEAKSDTTAKKVTNKVNKAKK